MILALIIFGLGWLMVPGAHSAAESSSLVCIKSGVEITATSLAGISYAEYYRNWTNGLDWNDFDRLREQTGAHRTKSLAEAKGLGPLRGALSALARSQYQENVRRAMALRLAEELVLRRDPSRYWYCDSKAMRECNQHAARLWCAESQVWNAALSGLPADEIKKALLEAYRATPPAWLAQIRTESWAASPHLQRSVDQVVSLRSRGGLERWLTGRLSMLPPQFWHLRDPGQLAEQQWIYAEIFNWWIGYVLRAFELRPDARELERLCRPMIPRYVLVGKVELAEDLAPIERLVDSIKDVAGVRLDWTQYQQALGFEREFGFTNRHLTGILVTNGMLGQLLADVDKVPMSPLRLPAAPVVEAPLTASFVPYRENRETKGKLKWVPVKLSAEGEQWAALQLRTLRGDSAKMRAWISAESEGYATFRWDNEAGELIRKATFDRIVELRLRPAVETLAAEYSSQDLVLFPTIDLVMEMLMLWRGLPYNCGDPYTAGLLIKEPVSR